jgi:hypothetical protein
MAVSPRNTPLSVEQRRALVVLIKNPHGLVEDLLMLTQGFDRPLIAGLVDEGLATARREIVTSTGHTTIEVVRIRISDLGRRALED